VVKYARYVMRPLGGIVLGLYADAWAARQPWC